MSTTMKTGLMIGIYCGIWTLLMGFTGWYKDPVLLNLFWVVVLIQIGLMIWGLRITATEGNTYGKQILTGTIMSIIGGAILFFISLIFTTLLFPNYFEELNLMQINMMRAAGVSETEISTALEQARATQTSFFQALFGFLGTLMIGIFTSLVFGAIYKKKATSDVPAADAAGQQ